MWIAIQNAVGARQGVGGGPGPGPGPGPLPYTPPLDVFTNAVLAYSVRKIRSDYTGPCLEAYRTSDGATLDINFDNNGLLNEAQLAAFYDGTPILVSRWYDQSSSGNNMVQATPANMPSVYQDFSTDWIAGGVSVARLRYGTSSIQPPLNSSFALYATGTSNTKRMDVVTPITSVSGPYSVLAISNGTNTSTNIYGNTGGQTLITRINSTRYQTHLGGSFTISDNSNAQNSLFVRRTASADLNFNSLDAPSGTFTGASGTLGDFHLWDSAFVGQYEGNISEFILFNDDKWSNRGAIINNSGAYFTTSLVVNPDAATSGFLFDYPDVSAAYSIRQLNNNATAALRVRRTVAPFDEQNIGFTPAGDLDTVAISTFGGADTLVVSRWYDQSGQSNHAVQISPGFQPQIYNGTSVVTKNGNPALAFGGTHFVAQIDVINQPSTYVSVHDIVTNSGYTYPWSAGNTLQEFTSFGLTQSIAIAGSYLNGPNIDDYMVSSVVFNGTSSIVRTNGTVGITGNTGTSSTGTSLGIGARFTGSNQLVSGSIMQELIVWPTNQTSPTNNLPAIETNIMTYYGIP